MHNTIHTFQTKIIPHSTITSIRGQKLLSCKQYKKYITEFEYFNNIRKSIGNIVKISTCIQVIFLRYCSIIAAVYKFLLIIRLMWNVTLYVEIVTRINMIL